MTLALAVDGALSIVESRKGGCLMASGPLSPQDWLLLVLQAARGRQLTPAQLQKALFLVEQELEGFKKTAKNYYKFQPYDYGPFCKDIYTDAEKKASEGFVTIELEGYSPYRAYRITEQGHERVVGLELDPEISAGVQTIVDNVARMGFAELVAYVYKKYPEMKVNSVFSR